MILKTLELSGFKSFVDQTGMDFTSGFTAVVGPNGCGKSNISDAVRWVIGEQSTKHLRGTRITDLIFNGTVDRKPVNRAEVTLTLGDVPEGLRIAGVPNSAEEIKVTRCYHRSGEGEFYINNVPCRLKDITDLFLDVGISPKVLTVIEQNHVQDIVTQKPEDRRIWIEEAAGVLKFKVRKNEALRKLDAAGQNLDRISDIVQELERQVESLKRQAAKAERYKEYQTQIKHLSLNLFGRRIRRLQTELETFVEELKQKSEAKAEKAARVSELETRIEQLRFDIDGLVAELNQKKETVHQLSRSISDSEHRIELKRQQIGQAESEIEGAGADIARMKEEIDGHAGEAESRRTELTEVGQRIGEQEHLVEGKSKEQSGLKAELEDTEQQLRTGEEHVLSLWHRMSQKQNEVTALTTRGEQIQSHDAKLQAEETRNAEETAAARTREEEAARLHSEKETHYAAVKQEQEAARLARDEARSSLEAQRQAVLETKDTYLTQASMLKSLTELRKKFEGYGEGVRALMGNSNGDRLNGLREVLGDVLRAPEEYETALEAVLGGRLQGMIVDSYQDSAAAIRYLREHKTGRGSFIPMNPKAAPKPRVYLNGNPGVIGKASDYVETSGDYKTLLDHLLADVVLVRDFDTALHLHGQDQFQGTVVTLTGEVIDTEGVVTGGAVAESTDGLLARNRELETRAAEVTELEIKLGQAEGEERQRAETLQSREQALADVDDRVQEAEIARAGSLKDLQQMKQETERLVKKQETLSLERQANEQELQEIARLQETLAEELEQVEQDKRRGESRVAELKALASEQRTLVDQAGAAIHEMQVLLTSLIGKRETLVSEIKRLEQQQEALKQRIRQREGEQGINRDKIENCEKVIAQAEQEILEQARAKDELAGDITKEEESLREQETELAGHEQELRNGSKALQELSEELFRVETRKNEIQMQVQHLEEKAFEDYSVNRDELIHNYTEELDEEETAEKVSELKEKVRKLGDVNLAALSDFQIANERYLFLHQQQEDLAASILTLHQTIENIDKTTRQLFLDTFEQVNEHFKNLFSRLFLGGRAELSMTDPDNPLESGIEITASPAGKAMHNITLLSGGEKTMTAISLIFALLKVRPSPFCLLDEVDAPLDESNVVRFQEMLKEFAAETQFIIITHNQKTMSFADTLYGVTMEEHGVSKVVSVHLNN